MLRCTICDRTISSKQFRAHELGKSHKKKLKRQPAGVSPATAIEVSTAPLVPKLPNYCAVCDVGLSLTHEQGKRHQKKLKQWAAANANIPPVGQGNHCALCDVELTLPHEQGRKHLKKVKKAADLQRQTEAKPSLRQITQNAVAQWAAVQAEDLSRAARRAGAVKYMQGVCSAFCNQNLLGRCVLVPTGSSMLGVHTADSDIDAVLVVSGKFRVVDPFGDQVSGAIHLRSLFGVFQREHRALEVHCIDDHVRVPIIAMKVDGFEVDLSVCRLLDEVPASLSRDNLSLFSPASPNAAALPAMVDPLTQLQMNGIRDGLYLQEQLTPAGRVVLRYVKAWAKATGMCKVGFPGGLAWALLVTHFSPASVDSFFRSLQALLESPRTVHARGYPRAAEASVRPRSDIVNWSESERRPTEIFPVLSPNFPVVNAFLGANRHSIASLRATVDKTLAACGGSEQAYVALLDKKHSTAFLKEHTRFVVVHLDAGKDTASFVCPKLWHVWAPRRKFPGESRDTPDLQLRGWEWCDADGGRQQAVNYVFGIPNAASAHEVDTLRKNYERGTDRFSAMLSDLCGRPLDPAAREQVTFTVVDRQKLPAWIQNPVNHP